MKKITLIIATIYSFIIISCVKTPISSTQIIYPNSGAYGINLLDSTTINYNSGNYTFKAIVPANQSLKVKLSGIASWSYDIGKIGNWYYTDYNSIENSRIFYSNHNSVYEMEINVYYPPNSNRDSLKIEVFENISNTPTRVKNIKII